MCKPKPRASPAQKAKRTSFITVFSLALAVLAVVIKLAFNNLYCVTLLDEALDRLQGAVDYNLNQNRYLQSEFHPVSDEHKGMEMEVLEGKVPAGLEGIFLRNGPNPVPEHGFKKRNMWFDGHGHLHTARLKDGKVLYSNQYIRTPRYTLEQEQGKEVFNQIGELYGFIGIFKALFLLNKKRELLGISKYEVGQANTNMILFGDEIWALHEGSFPFRVQFGDDGAMLPPLGYENGNGLLDYTVSAHPKLDPRNGRMLFHGYEPDHSNHTIKYGVYSPDKHEVVSYFGLNTKVPTWAHDMMITASRSIMIESSVWFSGEGIMDGAFFSYQPEEPLRLAVFDQMASSTDEVTWCQADKSYMIVHPMNAWDEGDDVVMWAPVGEDFDGTLHKGGNVYYIAELRINTVTKKIKVTKVDDQFNTEFPRVNPNFLGERSNFGYAGIMEGGDATFKGVAKYDLFEKKLDSFIRFEDGVIGGESVPVPKPDKGADKSDAIYLANFVHNTKTNLSEFRLYDGETMSNTPVVRMAVPARVPLGFHGEWIGEEGFRKHVARARNA